MNADSDSQPCEGIACMNDATLRCSGCKKAWYCSPECQKYAWTFHIFKCKPHARIRPGYHLALACQQDLIPSDPQTREDYGFNRMLGDEGYLVGLYQGLFIIYEYKLEARTLDEWVREGTLLQHIKEAFERFPSDRRGLYYPWFLRNQWILDGSLPRGMRRQAGPMLY